MGRLKQSGRATRWAWLVTTLALGVALIASAAANYRAAHSAADELMIGYAQTFKDAVLVSVRPGEHVPEGVLDSLVRGKADAGLRYVALVDEGGNVVTSSGTSEPGSSALGAPRLQRLEHLGARVRAYLPAPGPPAGRDSRPSGGTRRPPPTIVLEFEPIAATAIVSRATRSLAISVVVAVVLMAAGGVLWRLQQRVAENERRFEADRRLALLGQMSAVLAHEIRNPLASLKGHAQLLEERLDPGSHEHRKASRVVDEARRLENITNDLLDLARSGPMEVRPIDPAVLLEASVRDLGGAPIEVDTSMAPERWPLDERRFRENVLGNLLRNAVEASPAGQPARARVALDRGNLVFTVRDFGSGLPDGQEERIFDPFFTTRTTGTGLGLPVARRIVDLHGGRLLAANAEGGGAVFTVELPPAGAG